MGLRGLINNKDRRLSIELRSMARDNGLCDLWYSKWRDNTDVDKLLDMYVRGFDFCTEHDYPPLDFIRENFRLEDLHRHHIYLDESVAISKGSSDTYIFLGDCTGEIRFSGFAVSNVYIRHDSNINVICDGYSKVFVSLYEDSDCNIVLKSGTATAKTYDRR